MISITRVDFDHIIFRKIRAGSSKIVQTVAPVSDFSRGSARASTSTRVRAGAATSDRRRAKEMHKAQCGGSKVLFSSTLETRYEEVQTLWQTECSYVGENMVLVERLGCSSTRGGRVAAGSKQLRAVA